MSIWDQVSTTLLGDVESALLRLREGPELARCESELERAFLAYMILGLRMNHIPIFGSREQDSPDLGAMFLEPQAVLGNYRVDFLFGLVKHRTNLLKCIVIECDGHDWHERTKEQAARDKARDRFLSTQVGRVIHFTGSELYREMGRCALEAAKMLFLVADGKPFDD